MYKLFHIILSVLLFGWLLPLTLLLFVFKRVKIVEFRKNVYRVFDSKNRFIRNLPLTVYAMTGMMPLVSISRRRYLFEDDPSLKSGFFTLEFIRRAGGIAHEKTIDIDREYLAKRSFKTDIAIIIKTIPALLFSVQNVAERGKNVLFGVEFENITMTEALSEIRERIESARKTVISFVNPDCFNKLFKDTEYRDCLRKSDLIFPDGIGLVIACRIKKRPLRQNVNGTDMLPYLCEMCIEKGFSIYLLGAGKGVADVMRDKLIEKYPSLKISGVRSGFFKDAEDRDDALRKIALSAPDIVLVAMGVPMQELFISRYFERMNATVAMGVGGLFDFYSGRIKRAPRWMRECGLEWTYRLAMEPRRMFKRYIIGNPLFLWRVIFKEKQQ